MGLFCVNFHVRGITFDKVAKAMDRVFTSEVQVLPALSGWVSFYDERASQQDEDQIQILAEDVSAELGAPVSIESQAAIKAPGQMAGIAACAREGEVGATR